MGTTLYTRRNNLRGVTLRAVVTEVCHGIIRKLSQYFVLKQTPLLPVTLIYLKIWWTVTLRGAYRLKVFAKKVLRAIALFKRENVTEGWRKLDHTTLIIHAILLGRSNQKR
jgi:hypothetical protein